MEGLEILTLSGEIDGASLVPIEQKLDRLIGDGTKWIVLNVAELEFVDSSALGVFITSHKRLQTAGGELVFSAPSRFLRSVLGTLGLDRLFRVVESDEEAARQFVQRGA